VSFSPRTSAPADRGLRLIAGFKLFKGLLLLAVGFGALQLLHRDVADTLASLVYHLHLRPENRYVGRLLALVVGVDPRRLRAISAGTFTYAALLLTEGIGLLLRQRWAEYLTAIITGSFIPLELYELARRWTFTRMAVVVVNAAIVWYLIRRLRDERRATGPRTTRLGL
jgi:uncharacterized membrane protein (DUF2068 family)